MAQCEWQVLGPLSTCATCKPPILLQKAFGLVLVMAIWENPLVVLRMYTKAADKFLQEGGLYCGAAPKEYLSFVAPLDVSIRTEGGQLRFRERQGKRGRTEEKQDPGGCNWGPETWSQDQRDPMVPLPESPKESSSWNRKWGRRWARAASLHGHMERCSQSSKQETSGAYAGWAIRMAWSRSTFAWWLFKLGSW